MRQAPRSRLLAVEAHAAAEGDLGAAGHLDLDLCPAAVILADLFTLGADGQLAGEGLDLAQEWGRGSPPLAWAGSLGRHGQIQDHPLPMDYR